jgi:hypothetical protein
VDPNRAGDIMIPLIISAALAVLLGAPVLVDPARRAAARRAAARDQRDADARRRQQEAAAAQAELTQLWTDEPITAGTDETLRFKTRIHDGLMRQLREHTARLRQWEEQVRRRERHVRDGKPVTAGYRLRVLAGLALFLVVFGLGIGLDYLIFRGLHPTGTFLLPLALACLAVIGITAGAVLCFDATRHQLVHATATPYVRRVVALGGAMLVAGITVYMTVIAPYRSIPAGQAAITLAEQTLASDQSQVVAGPAGSNSQLINADQQAVVQARAHLAQAERVDRWSAAVLAVLDIPLSEAGFLGAELLLLDLAVLHRKLAQRRAEQAAEARLAAENAYINALHQILTRHGHTNADELIPLILARVGRLMTWVRQSSAQGHLEGIGPGRPAGASDHPAREDAAGQGEGPAAGPAAAPPPEDDNDGPAPQVTVIPPDRMTVIPPDPAPAGPRTGPEDGTPSRPGTRRGRRLTFISPEGGPVPPGTRRQQAQADGGAASSAGAELPPEEFDMTA